MPGPIDSLRFVHTALEREITELEGLVHSPNVAGERAKLTERFEFLEHVCDGHTRGEEHGLFPELDAKFPNYSRTYLFDHVDEREAFARIKAALAEGAPEPLRREVTCLADHLRRHIRKENELVLPLVHEHFAAPEQGAMVGRIVSVFSPADMAKIVPFIMGWLDADDRIRYGTILAGAVPPAALAALAAHIRDRLDATAWEALVQGVPALGATT